MKLNKLRDRERTRNEMVQEEKQEEERILRGSTVKDLISPSGIDASHIDHLEIISNVKRYVRSFYISEMPRQCTFPELFRDIYLFGDINTSLYINPIQESKSQSELNKTINELETERIVAIDRGDINKERTIAQKRVETEGLRDEIAAGFNKLYELSLIHI